MKKNVLILLALSSVFAIGACTEKTRTRSFGGTEETRLPCNTKLVNMTWKEANLWTLTRPAVENEVFTEYTFAEDSSFGTFEGTVTIKESACAKTTP
jgi:hypothetical protein